MSAYESIGALPQLNPEVHDWEAFEQAFRKSDRLVEWILEQDLLFDSLYYDGSDPPIHDIYSSIYSSQRKQSVCFVCYRMHLSGKDIERTN